MAIHKLRALEYLVAVIEHGGFAAAGRRLGVAAPSIHRLVSALESELGLPLLDRSSSPIRPTPDAVRYVDRARQLIGELQGLDMSLRDRAGAPAGIVTGVVILIAESETATSSSPHITVSPLVA